MSAIAATCSSATAAGATISGGALTATPPSPQAASAGTISVAIRPGALRAAAIARAVSGPRSAAVATECTQSENGAATASMSVSSGDARPWCAVPCSPTMLTIGLRARRALCTLARPLARPGPRCSRVAAGFPAMRA